MPATRKTVSVETVKAKFNSYLAQDNEYVTADFRRGVIAALDSVLFESGNYRGYTYVGMTFNESTQTATIPDETMRRYY